MNPFSIKRRNLGAIGGWFRVGARNRSQQSREVLTLGLFPHPTSHTQQTESQEAGRLFGDILRNQFLRKPLFKSIELNPTWRSNYINMSRNRN